MSIVIETVYEDAWLKIINKPSNLIVHHSKYARNIDEESLCQLLNKTSEEENLHPIHRLDRKTSGLIVFAKDKTIIQPTQALFNSNDFQKTYVALVRGHVLTAGLLDFPIRADEATTYKDAETQYKPLHHFEVPIPVQPYPSARYTLLQLQPKTGRMHQLRKHMNKFSHPIIGDPKYGNRHHNHMFIDELGIGNLFLHAHQVSFPHPINGKTINVTGRFPEFWRSMLKQLNVDYLL
ncbi:MAG: pseudouridine synthase [Putridiphycobacter sp.]|nr:pseudouridine synthase [Putridiphycobacter sp.]